MKKLSTLLIIAFALVLGLTQCKKKVDTIATPSDLGKTVHITVNVGGDKHEVFPNTGAVVYTGGDKIYVGDGKKYLGTLTYGSGAFSGDITEPAVGDYLYFYFLGGLTPSATPVAGTTTDFTVSIANQSGKLPVLSYGRSTDKYTTSTATYGCTLLNKCGLVKFTLVNGTSEAVKVAGMKTGATINFADPSNPIVANGTKDAITLKSESETEKWAILLPQDAVSDGLALIDGKAYSCDMAAVENNSYITTNTIDNTTPTTEKVFTVSTDGNVVRFSPGNLQYKAGEGWRFAPNQYDYVGAWNTSDWVDLFGWGTWGQGKNPLNTSDQNSDYQWSTDFQGTLDGHDDWYTLSKTEWQYLFNSRTNAGNLYGTATVVDAHGIVLLPDNWTLPTGSSFNPGLKGWNNNTYDASAWATMKTAGAVFLPAAGSRYGTGVDYVGGGGYYWSSTPYDEGSAWSVVFGGSSVGPDDSDYRIIGQSVRLVR